MGWVKDCLDFVSTDIPTKYYAWRDKRTLKKMLKNPDFPNARTIEVLQRAIGRDTETARRFLGEIGARQVKMHDGGEGWTLRPHPG